MDRFTGLLGLVVILAVAWLSSTNRRAIQPRVLFWGLTLQFGFAFLVLKTDFGQLFQLASYAVNALLDYAEKGRAEIVDAGGNNVVGIVRKNIENVTTDDLVPHGHGGLEIRVRNRNDGQFTIQNQVQTGDRLKEGTEVDITHRVFLPSKGF